MNEDFLTVTIEERPEGTTVLVHGTFQSDDEPPVALLQADLFALTATILDGRSRAVIGDWDEKDVRGVNGGSWGIPEGGTDPTRFTLRIPPDDLVMLTTRDIEKRRVCLAWTYNGGVDANYAEVTFPLKRRTVAVP